MSKKTKTLDCVEMKRRGAEMVQQKLGSMTAEQEIEYWRERSVRFQAEQEQLRSKRRRTVVRMPVAKVKAYKKLARRIDAEEGEEIKALGREIFRRHEVGRDPT